jgi:DNA modification methylase
LCHHLPPYYWLRDYKVEGQIGQEETVIEYVETMCAVMDQVYRVLKKDGVLFLNIGDTYYSGKGEPQGPDRKSSKRRFGIRAVDKSGGLGLGLRPKTSIGIPWRVAIEMSQRQWVLRSPIIWHRKHALPEHVNDRPRRTYEHIFMFVKNRKYFFNRQALIDADVEDMWTITARPEPTNGIDTAPFPDELVERCLAIGCPAGGSVLDPFSIGSEWFLMQFPSLQLRPNPTLSLHQKAQINATIARLRLNGPICIKSRNRWIKYYCQSKFDFDYLKRHASLIARELERQDIIDKIKEMMNP